MSVKKNITLNSISQGYFSIVRILIIPILIKHMGAEAYGLTGFYSTLVALSGLLSFGLTPTISRGVIRLYAGDVSSPGFFKFYTAVKKFFLLLAVTCVIVSFLFADALVDSWFKISDLARSDVIFALRLMSISAVLRWLSSPYISVLTGAERFVWYSGFLAFIATLRFLGVVVVMYFFGFNVRIFFLYELLISLIELGLPFLKARRVISKFSAVESSYNLQAKAEVKSFFQFSLSNALSDGLWIVFCQFASVILSGILSMSQYGYFSLALSLANGVYLLSAPISLIALPRLSVFYISKQYKNFKRFYREFSQILTAVGVVSSVVVWGCAEQFLYLWTRDVEIVENTHLIFKLYTAGNALMLLCRMPFIYQYAQGNLVYHLVGSAIQLSILIPLTIVFSQEYGGVGAGEVWLALNMLYLVIWVSYSHYKLGFDEWKGWLFSDVFKVGFPAIVVVWLIKENFLLANNPTGWLLALQIAVVTLVSTCVVIFSSGVLRERCLLYIRRWILNIK